MSSPAVLTRTIASRESHRPSRPLRSSVLFSLLANGLPPLASLASAPILAQALGVDARGQVAAATAPLLLATAVATFGVPAAVTHFVARHPAIERSLVRGGSVLLLLTGIVTSLGVFAASAVLADGEERLRELLLLALLALVPTLMVGLLRAVAAGRHAWRCISAAQAITAFVRLGALAVLWSTGRLDVTAAVLVLAAAPVAGGIAYLSLARKRSDRRAEASGAPAGLLALGSYGMRVWIGSIAGMILLRLDQTLLTPLSGVEQLGLYVVAASMAEVPLIITNAVRDVVFSADSARSDDARLLRASRLTTSLTGAAALVVAGAAPFALPRLFGPEFAAALPVCLILLLATVVGNSLAGIALSARGRPGLRSGALAVACFVNVALVALLAPSMGALGAAVATLVANAVAGSVNVLMFSRLHGVSPLSFLALRRGDLQPLADAARRMSGRGGSASQEVAE